MTREDLGLAAILAAVLLAVTALAPVLVAARPAYEIPVHDARDGESLDRADGAAWAETSAVTLPLSSSGAAVPAGGDASVGRATVEAATTDDRLYLRLSWADTTEDRSTDAIRGFADAVAVQFPVDERSQPPITMGSTDDRVNVWYWSGANTTEELLAGGPGTTTRFETATVRTNATYSDGRWRVVFSRPLQGGSENRTTVPAGENLNVAFAVWNGSNQERSGQKGTSEWYYLALGPGPQGPPYEALLWTVAGIAIVVTTLVTIEGVRRTRGE